MLRKKSVWWGEQMWESSGARGSQTEPWGDTDTRASLSQCDYVVPVPWRCSTLVRPHCQTEFHQQQLICNDSFALWRGMLVKDDTDQEPGAVARRVENNPAWLNDAFLLEASFVWVRDVMFDAVYQEGNAYCAKGSQLDRTSWQRRTQSAHDTHCGWQSTIKCWGRDLWLLHGRLMQTPCTWRRPVGRRPPRRFIPSVFLFPVLVPRTFWQQPNWHTQD